MARSWLDKDKLEKVVLNLLFNALKFTPWTGRVWLRAEKQGGDLVVVVSDTGVGIAEENLMFVFDRFWQADGSSRRKFQGVGIGLALVKELVDMMGGSVTVQSQEGKGATFTVRLPYQKAEALPKSQTSAPNENGVEATEEWLANLYRRAEFFPAVAALRGTVKPVELAGRRPVVLVADDEPDMRRFLRSELNEDYDVLEAADGLQAREKAEQFLPDIILLDMMMPEMDGLEVCQEPSQARNHREHPDHFADGARGRGRRSSTRCRWARSDFLAKPFSTTELHARAQEPDRVASFSTQAFQAKPGAHHRHRADQGNGDAIGAIGEKLASLGRLSAGIIHEINNPLNFTMTGLFALRNKNKQLAPAQRDEYNEILNDVEEGVNACATSCRICARSRIRAAARAKLWK